MGGMIPIPKVILKIRLDNYSNYTVLFTPSVMFNSFATPWAVACQALLSMGFLPGQDTGVS